MEWSYSANVLRFGCAFCRDDQNRLFGHVTQIGSDDSRQRILLRCPRCGALYENAARGRDRTRRLTADAASKRYPAASEWARGITTRVERRVRAEFADPQGAMRLLDGVESANQDRERVIAAVVIAARGDVQTLVQLVALSHSDWRDVLVSGGLANADWRSALDDALGPAD